MARIRRKPQYVTVPEPLQTSPCEQEVSLVDLRMAGVKRVLLLDLGYAAEAVVYACQAAGVASVAAYVGDSAQQPHLSLAEAKVCIGATQEVFQDSYCVLAAAEVVEASVILLAEPESALAQDPHFLRMAQDLQQRVYLLDQDVFVSGSFGGTSKAWRLLNGQDQETPRLDASSWAVCPACRKVLDAARLQENHKVCPACGHHFRMTSADRIQDLLDADGFVEWEHEIPQTDPLDFPGYQEKLQAVQERTNLTEAVRCGLAHVAGIPFALSIMDSTFLMGSMGSVAGERITRTVERATAERLPLVIFCASGGARMQEGLISLMQMAKVSAAIKRHAEAGLPYFSVITDPTTGGVTASFAMQGDIILAEPGALIGFAGRRVIQDTIRQKLPKEFQTAEFALEHGLIDAVVQRSHLRKTLANLLALFTNRADLLDESFFQTGTPSAAHLFDSAEPSQVTCSTTVKPGCTMKPRKLSKRISTLAFKAVKRGKTSAPSSVQEENPAWSSVEAARNTRRPTSAHYRNFMVRGFVELHGDRAFADDAAIVAGVGWIDHRAVMLISQEKGADLQERIRRNFGCPQPEGYRKSLRLMRLAERFGLPVVCLVDTQGAFCGKEAEERGQGNAIADNLFELAGLRVPVVSVLVGEGGSGGALALALSDRVAMQEHAVYSVLSPEGFASILWKDRSRAPEAAALMRTNAHDVHVMGVVDAVLEEGEGTAAQSPYFAAQVVRHYVVRTLNELQDVPPDQLLEQRYQRFRKF